MEADLGAGTVGAGEAALPGRSVHLDQLRRPRGRPDGAGRILHLDPEDDVPYVRDPVRRAARDAGLMPGQLVVTPSVTHAVTDALERGDVLLCTEATARAAGLRWRRLSGVSSRDRRG